MIKWSLEKRELKSLKKWDKNPRRILEKPLKDLRESIDKFGLAEPIIIQPYGLIIGGHARYEVCKDKGIKEIDCYVPDRELTEDELKELNVRLNKNVAGEFDFDILANEFDADDLMEWGFKKEELFGSFEKDFDDSNKEIDIDSFGNQCILKLVFENDVYLELLNRLNALKQNDETNEQIFLKALGFYESNV